MGKISKSRGGGPMAPMEMIERYSADAVRYWAASAGPGKDAVISEEKIQNGARLATKLWNVAQFSARFLQRLSAQQIATRQRLHACRPLDPGPRCSSDPPHYDALPENYDYAAAKSEVEDFFWRDLADNYLEMCKLRLYDADHPQRSGALQALHSASAEYAQAVGADPALRDRRNLPGLVCSRRGEPARFDPHHAWPDPDPALEDEQAEDFGKLLVQIATAVRRYKSEHNLALGSELARLQIRPGQNRRRRTRPGRRRQWRSAIPDLKGVTRAREIELATALDPRLERLASGWRHPPGDPGVES